MPTATLQKKKQLSGPTKKYFYANCKKYRGRLPNGRVGLNQKENKCCIELLKRGISHKVIAKNLKLTVCQVQYRASLVGMSVMDYRRGKSPESIVILKRFSVVYN
ncbi:hypothetical protein LCGC14_1337090 [marine sediment metagenome]|uniref:Uncharacterized protein n=1 Tax=marine sediment metagenome TaxID=412755 RepID=A0A0F9KFJ7_9ZZZZ